MGLLLVSLVLLVYVYFVLGIFSIPAGIRDSNEAKLLVVVKTLELSSSREDLSGVKTIVEFDSSNVVNHIRPWYYHEIFVLATHFSSRMADGLAQQGVSGNCDFIAWL
jgi:hypothetical protein